MSSSNNKSQPGVRPGTRDTDPSPHRLHPPSLTLTLPRPTLHQPQPSAPGHRGLGAHNRRQVGLGGGREENRGGRRGDVGGPGHESTRISQLASVDSQQWRRGGQRRVRRGSATLKLVLQVCCHSGQRMLRSWHLAPALAPDSHHSSSACASIYKLNEVICIQKSLASNNYLPRRVRKRVAAV